jgi:hypothetical protein
MSEGKKLGRPFTPETAPRTGGKPGRKNKLSRQALQILDKLMRDWKLHGASTLKILRLEQPAQYARLCVETAAKLGLAESADTVIDNQPVTLIVRWGAPSPRPIETPPEVSREVSPFAPPVTPRLLTFEPPDVTEVSG